MIKKLQFLISLVLLSSILFAQRDSIKIGKAVLLFYDSTEFAPLMHKIPFDEAYNKTFVNLEYKNEGRLMTNYTLEFKITHVSFPPIQGGPGLGLIHRKRLQQDSLLINELIDFQLSLPRYRLCNLGNYKADFFIYNNGGAPLDSSYFIFEITDSIYLKSSVSSTTIATGPGLFSDTVLNQTGGTTQGDRFGTLFAINNGLGLTSGYIPSSSSFFVSNDTANLGAEIVPKIWKTSIDSVSKRIVVGQLLASSFVPTLIDSSHLGRIISPTFDFGPATINGLSAGKYIVGFESTLPNPNGKSLLIGRDTLGESIQPDRTSFVYFGHDTNWYSINHQPIIGLNFANLPYLWFGAPGATGCSTVPLQEANNNQTFPTIYPNPSTGVFIIENFETNQMLHVYDINGRLLKTSIINGRLDLSEQPKGIYLLRVTLENGEVVSKKLMKY